MSQQVDYNAFVAMLNAAAEEIRANHELLSQLDSVGGDGDHGTTMVRAMTKLVQAVESAQSDDLKTLLHDVGWAILGVDGGATGPLLGMFFISMAEAAPNGGVCTSEGLTALFAAGLAGVRAQTKAQPGDKTMMDALVPAVEALCNAPPDADVCAMMDEAAREARLGAEGTSKMQARFGRARNIKEQSIGTQDPGATSVALIFNGFRKGLQAYAGRG